MVQIIRKAALPPPGEVGPSGFVRGARGNARPYRDSHRRANYGTHKTAAVRRWLARHPRFHVHFTPTSASWINQVERFFATLTRRQIRRGTHRSTVELERAIKAYLQNDNRDPRPFVWTKTADQILESLKRFCLRTSNSGH